MNLFSWIDELFVKKRAWDSFSAEDQKKFSPFMVNRYLSMNNDFLPIINHFQKLTIEVMPIGVVYKFYCSLLPKKKTYLRYLSGKKTKTNEKVVPFIQKYFEVSKLQASEYYNLMTTDELKLLLKQYGKTDKEIKKMGVK
jgi:hypothetical protein|tara:strand:- start:10 stop:429 length:420 start_codon:yes stop_codon:yes gene_type:complete